MASSIRHALLRRRKDPCQQSLSAATIRSPAASANRGNIPLYAAPPRWPHSRLQLFPVVHATSFRLCASPLRDKPTHSATSADTPARSATSPPTIPSPPGVFIRIGSCRFILDRPFSHQHVIQQAPSDISSNRSARLLCSVCLALPDRTLVALSLDAAQADRIETLRERFL